MQNRFTTFADLTPDLQQRVKNIASEDVETWLRSPIPALGGKTFLEQLNEADGYQTICEYLTKIEGFLR